MLTSKQRAALRSCANTMEPVFQIGKGEIDEPMINAIGDCLAARELIKIKCLETAEYTAKEAADILCEALSCESVQVIGRKFVLFKQKNKESAYAETLNPTLAAKKKPAKPAAKPAAKAARPGKKSAPWQKDGKPTRFYSKKK